MNKINVTLSQLLHNVPFEIVMRDSFLDAMQLFFETKHGLRTRITSVFSSKSASGIKVTYAFTRDSCTDSDVFIQQLSMILKSSLYLSEVREITNISGSKVSGLVVSMGLPAQEI